MVDSDDEDSSFASDALFSQEPASDFHPSDDDIEIDNEFQFCDATEADGQDIQDDNHLKEHTADEDYDSDGTSDSDGTNDTETSDIEASYDTVIPSNYTRNADCTDDSDNLFCPGDIILYQERGLVSKSRIVAIEDSENKKSIHLENGQSLHPQTHKVLKLKVYDFTTKEYTNNPVTEWFDISDCMLQVGTLTDISNNCNDSVDADSGEQRDSTSA